MTCTYKTRYGDCKNYVKKGHIYCWKHVKQHSRLDPRDLSNPGIAKRMQNLIRVPNIPSHMVKMIEDCANQQEMAAKYAPAILASLVDLALHCEIPTVRASCCMYLSDKIYGKAIQPLLIEQNVKVSLGVIMLEAPKINNVIEVDENDFIIEESKDVQPKEKP